MSPSRSRAVAVHILSSGLGRHGGVEIYTSEAIKRLVARGFDITVFVPQDRIDERTRSVCRVIEISRGSSDALPVLWRLSPLLQLVSVMRDMKKQMVDVPDVVIGNAQQLMWAHSKLYPDRPLIYFPHSMIAPVEISSYPWRSRAMRAIGVRLWDSLERRYLNSAFRTVRFTRAACELLEQHYGRRVQPRFEVIPSAVDLPDLPPPAPRSGPVRLVSVSRLVRSKNLSVLIQALADLRDSDWRLDILGDGAERAALEAQVRQANLSNRIAFRGHVDPGEFYAGADLHVMPSVLENSPLVILEAMAYRVPTLAFKSDGIQYVNANDELITHGCDGFLAADDRDFARQLERLIGSRDTLMPVGIAARQTAASRHSWTRHLDAWERLLRAAASSQ